jgi:hypothetical protein
MGRLFRKTHQTNPLFPELMTFLEGEEYAPLDCRNRDKEARLFILGSCILMAEEEIEQSKPHLAGMAM